jgi:hypothetical protein
MHWPEILAGALTGLIVGMTGVGGGALMTPILLLLFGVAPATAVGTDLWFAAFTKVAAMRIHHGQGLIDWPVVKRLWLGSLVCSTLTLLVLRWYPLPAGGAAVLTMAIAGAVLLTAAGLLFQARLHGWGRRLRLAEPERFKAWQAPLTVLAGAMLGVLVTLTSVGAGALGVVFLAHLYPLRLTPSRLVATDIVHAIPLAVFAGLGHLVVGNVDFRLLASLLCGSIPAAILGAMLSSRIPQPLLRGVLVAVLLAVGFKLWLAGART